MIKSSDFTEKHPFLFFLKNLFIPQFQLLILCYLFLLEVFQKFWNFQDKNLLMQGCHLVVTMGKCMLQKMCKCASPISILLSDVAFKMHREERFTKTTILETSFLILIHRYVVRSILSSFSITTQITKIHL